MLERIKKNINKWHFHSLGMTILAIVVILKGHIEISFALMGISTVLMGIGALYNQNKEQRQKLNKILINQKTIISYLSGKYDNLDMNDTLSQEELDELLKAK